MELIKIGATWCGQCKVLDVQLKKFKDKFPIKSLDVEVDFDEIEKLPKVKNLPTLLFLKDGEVVKTLVGAIKAQDIEQVLTELQ